MFPTSEYLVDPTSNDYSGIRAYSINMIRFVRFLDGDLRNLYYTSVRIIACVCRLGGMHHGGLFGLLIVHYSFIFYFIYLFIYFSSPFFLYFFLPFLFHLVL